MISSSQRSVTLATGAGAGVLAGAAAMSSPGAGLLLAALALAGAALSSMSAEAAGCALIAYLPFEGMVASHAPPSALVGLRLVPEGAALALAVAALLKRSRRTVPAGRWPAALVGATMIAWLASAVANGVPIGTYALGVRAELRFLPLAVVFAFSATPRRHTRMLATTIAVSTLVQVVVVGLEIAGGTAVRHVFAQNYTVDIGGMTVTHFTVDRTAAITGSLRTYNELAAYLVAGWLVVAFARSTIALSRYVVWAGLIATPLAVLASGSRSGALFLAFAVALVVKYRFRVPVFRIAGVVLLIASLTLPWWAPSSPSPVSRSTGLVTRIATRWSVALQSETWSGTYGSRNFRLFMARDEIESVLGHSPAFGWGTGTIDDPRASASGANPLLHSMAGRLAVASNFAYDGNWPLVLMQSGFLGLGCVFALIAGVGLVGRSLAATHWLGHVLVATSLGVALLGLFAPVLQQHALSAEYWAFAGCGLSLAAARRAPASARKPARGS
jgi:hypothetical protein